MNLRKILWMTLGFITLTLGTIGLFLPILPTCPFLLLASFCFSRTSDKLNNWFKNTKIYKDNIEDFVAGKGMTLKTKIKIMTTLTLFMAIGFIAMGLKGIVVGCVSLFIVWAFHVWYISFRVKTI